MEPYVVAAVGHLDVSERLDTPLAAEVSKALDDLSAKARSVGREPKLLTGLAEGADTLVAQIAVEKKWKIEAVLSAPPGVFEKRFPDEPRRALFHRLLDQSKETVVGDPAQPSDRDYAAVSQRMLDKADVLLAIWDGRTIVKEGGTLDTMQRAKSRGIEVVTLRAPVIYEPKPTDTSDVNLLELGALAEELAEEAHEVWAEQRMADGWTYGDQRDDPNKRTPNLRSYDQLPEHEREYDRRMSTHTLKLITLRGYSILPANPLIELNKDAPPATDTKDDMVDDVEIAWQKSRNQSVLADRLAWIQKELVKDYRAADSRARSEQKRYLAAALYCTLSVVGAVLLSVYQLAEGMKAPAFVGPAVARGLDCIYRFLPWAEVGFVGFASVLVIRDYRRNGKNSWLTSRSRAERLRALKYHALLDPRMWSSKAHVRLEAEIEFASRKSKIEAMEPEQVESYAEDVDFDPKVTASLTPDPHLHAAIVGYYYRWRLDYQAQYAATRTYHESDLKFKWLVPGLFFSVPLFVMVHLGTDFWDGHSDAAKFWGILAAVLPACGAALHVFRSGREWGRNHLRTRSLALRLRNLRDKLEKPCTVSEQIRIMKQCEAILASEHQQWLHLMMEAEWYA
jgi:hypothetical protein